MNKYDFSFFYLPIQKTILTEGLPSAAQDFENILSEELDIVRSNFTWTNFYKFQTNVGNWNLWIQMDPLKDAKHTACPQPRYQPYQMGRLFDLRPVCMVQ